MKITNQSGDRDYFTIIPNYILNHSTMWDREVYIQMKRIAGENGTCWASQSKLAEQCGMSINRLKKSIKYLVEHNWIKCVGEKKTKTSGGKQPTKEYKIIDIWDLNNQWKIKKGGNGVSRYDTPSNKGVSYDDTKGYHQVTKGVSPGDDNKEPGKKNHKKKNSEATASQVNFVSEIIKLFEEVNPACKNYYGNTTQRKAVENLIDTYSLKKVKEVIAILPQSNQMAYVPTITTPYQLEQKWVQLESTLKKKKNEIKSKKPNVI